MHRRPKKTVRSPTKTDMHATLVVQRWSGGCSRLAVTPGGGEAAAVGPEELVGDMLLLRLIMGVFLKPSAAGERELVVSQHNVTSAVILFGV